MNWLDVLVLIVLAAASFSSLRAGFLRQAFSIIGFVVGIYVALMHRDSVAGALGSVITHPGLAGIVSFCLVFVTVWFGAAALASLAYRGLKSAGLAWADHLLGLVVGLAAGLLSTSGLVVLLGRVPIGPLNQAVSESELASLLFGALPHLLPLLPEDLRLFTAL